LSSVLTPRLLTIVCTYLPLLVSDSSELSTALLEPQACELAPEPATHERALCANEPPVEANIAERLDKAEEPVVPPLNPPFKKVGTVAYSFPPITVGFL